MIPIWESVRSPWNNGTGQLRGQPESAVHADNTFRIGAKGPPLMRAVSYRAMTERLYAAYQARRPFPCFRENLIKENAMERPTVQDLSGNSAFSTTPAEARPPSYLKCPGLPVFHLPSHWLCRTFLKYELTFTCSSRSWWLPVNNFLFSTQGPD